MTTAVLYTDAFVAADHLDRGIALLRRNRFTESIFEFDQTLALTPDDPYAHWNKATALLSSGDYARGFIEHDWGWRLFNWRGFGPVGDDIDRLTVLPLWRGEDIADKHLLVYHELGFGDAIMTLRYLPELKRRARHVTLVISQPLTRLSQSFGVEVVERVPDDIGRYDFRLPFFGVMLALGETLATIPSAPYIAATGARCGGRMGIAWSGRTQTTFSCEYFLSMLEHEGYALYSLQPDLADGVQPLRAADFADTADLIAQMDHVVTVDTAVAHLAGALGHPSTHLLLPYLMDWRWWHSAAWYPTIRTYRQETPNDWATPFARLNHALRTHA